MIPIDFDVKIFNRTLQISDHLFFSTNKLNKPHLASANCIIIAGFSGCGKSTLTKLLLGRLSNYYNIPERRILTDKFIINPLMEKYNLKENFLIRKNRINLVNFFKNNTPEGIVYFLKNIYLSPLKYDGYIFDGIRGDDEIKAALECFPNAKIIHLTASEEVRKERIYSRNDSFDYLSSKNEVNQIIDNDYKLHNILESTIKINSNRYIVINTSNINISTVFEKVNSWILK
jgi:deoxyadenosine/deoxycytidine kinase